MTNEDIRKRYVHLLNLVWDYRKAENDWRKSNSSFDRDKTARLRLKLDTHLKAEKLLHDSQQDKNELF